MDRNTITGLVLIGLILTVFSIINRPSEEDIKEQQKKELAKTEKIKADKNKAIVNDSIVQDTTVTDQPIMTDATEMISDTVEPTVKQVVRDTVIVKETDKFIIHFSNIGGQIQSLYLKEYKIHGFVPTICKDISDAMKEHGFDKVHSMLKPLLKETLNK